jgi:hypothetical protein
VSVVQGTVMLEERYKRWVKRWRRWRQGRCIGRSEVSIILIAACWIIDSFRRNTTILSEIVTEPGVILPVRQWGDHGVHRTRGKGMV